MYLKEFVNPGVANVEHLTIDDILYHRYSVQFAVVPGTFSVPKNAFVPTYLSYENHVLSKIFILIN